MNKKNSKQLIFGIKIFYILFLLVFYGFNKRLLFDNSYIPLNITQKEENLYNSFTQLIDRTSVNNDTLIMEAKERVMKYISDLNHHEIIPTKTFFCYCNQKFGNIIDVLIQILFYADIIGYNHVILNKDKFWFIKNKIYIEKYNLTIETDDEEKYKNTNNDSIVFAKICRIFVYFYKFKPDIRLDYIRNELINNLPKTQTSRDELYIHIRSGDIFSSWIHLFYGQPPLCFYKKILNNFKFKKVILISESLNNIVIKYLLKDYPYIIYNKNDIGLDLSYLVYGYNIVASISSFVVSTIKFNYKLENIWDYNIHRMTDKIMHFHYDFYDFPHNNFTVFRMEPSLYYKNKMYYWKYNMKQKYLMINEKCENDFTIIKRNN